jgi:methionine synthase II (cobalamin-independent)
MRRITGLATGIGSLPFKDPDEALDLVFKHIPHIPFWPQLPKRDIREGMILQFSENLPCLEIIDGDLIYRGRDRDRELEVFYEKVISQDLDHFQITPKFAAGLHRFYHRLKEADLKEVDFIKLQITGPFTFLAGVNDEKGVSLLHDKVFRQALIKGLNMKALWQVKLFSEFAKKAIVFIDEPYLSCFGSAYTPLNKYDVVQGLTELGEGLKAAGALLGVHCCGNTDWSIFTDIPEVDIINFDAFSFQEKFVLYAQELSAFLRRGGFICWGVVPTQNFSGKEDPQMLAEKIRQGINVLSKKGVEEKLLLNNLLISPACGLGTFDQRLAEGIFELLGKTSDFIQKNF